MSTTTLAQWLSIDQAADYLNVSSKSVRRRISSGDLAARRVGPRLIRIDRRELDRMMSPVA